MPAPLNSSYLLDSLNENSSQNHHSVDVAQSFSDNTRRALLIGASDQKRLGDLLRPHTISRLFDFDSYRCAGLVSKELTQFGAHDVINFGEAALEMGGGDLNLVHMGGDHSLSGLVSAYNRSTEGAEYQRFVGLVQVAANNEMTSYVQRRSGQNSPLAYVLSPRGIFSGAKLSFFGLRVPDPSVLEEDQEEYLAFCGGESRFLGVSGTQAEKFFEDRGIECEQMPCSLSVLPSLCHNQLQKESSACSLLEERLKNGWVAVEVGEVPEEYQEDFAASVVEVATKNDWGIAIYSSAQPGIASPTVREKWQNLFGEQSCWFESKNIWSIARMIGQSRLYVGSCLDSRIIAIGFGVPRINLHRSDSRISDYCECWDMDSLPFTLGADRSLWSAELAGILDQPIESLKEFARKNLEAFQASLAKAIESTELTQQLFDRQNVEHFEAFLQAREQHRAWGMSSEKSVKAEREQAAEV